MKDWFKPLFTYKSYLLADKILKIINAYDHKLNLEFEGSPNDSSYELTFIKFKLEDIRKHFDRVKITNQDIIATIDLLQSAGHATLVDSKDFWKTVVICTHKGHRAAEYNYWKGEVVKFWWKVIGIPTGIIGLIAAFEIIHKLLG